MKQIVVMTVVGTRPEIIRLSKIIRELDLSEAISHTLVHTGQNYDYELNEIFFSDLDIREPDFYLDAAADNPVETIGNVLIEINKVFETVCPDALLVLGDTNSSLCAIAAKKKKIPIFHMEAGNRCFDQRVPEETNRIIVDHISDINLTYSDIAREYLLSEGVPPDRIIKTGSPMFEVLESHREKIDNSNICSRLGLKCGEFFVVSLHRDENTTSEEILLRYLNSINAVCDKYQFPIIFSTHPRTKKRLSEISFKFNPLVKLIKPLSFTDYNALQISAKAVLSDSGTISEESSILDFPALNLRESHERPEAMEEAAVLMVGSDTDRILQGLSLLELQSDKKRRYLNLVDDYAKPNVSVKVVRVIISYINYVNKFVWMK